MATQSCKLLIQNSAHCQSKHKISWNQKRKQIITEVLLSCYLLQPTAWKKGSAPGIKAAFIKCKVPLVQHLLEPHLIQRLRLSITSLNMLGAVGRGLFKTRGAANSHILLFPYIYCLKLTFLMWTNCRISMSSSLFLTSGRTVCTTWQTTGTMISLQESDKDSLYRSCWSNAIMWLWLADL